MMGKCVSIIVPLYPKPSSAHFFSDTLFFSVCLSCFPAVSIFWELRSAEHPWKLLQQVGYFCVMVCGSPSHFPGLRTDARLNATAVLGQDPGVHHSLVPAPLKPRSHANESSSPEPEHEPWHVVARRWSERSVERDPGACQGMHGNINIYIATEMWELNACKFLGFLWSWWEFTWIRYV